MHSKVYYCKKKHRVLANPSRDCRACDDMLKFRSKNSFMNWGFNRESWNLKKLGEIDENKRI
jgi:hypothetical protein